MTVTVVLIESMNDALAHGTIVLQVTTVLFLLDFLFARGRYFGQFIARFGYWIVFLGALAGTVLTLVYSEVFGFAPCGLCWLQRVALYPLVFIFAIALWKRDTLASLYGIVLSAFGAVISLYQHYLQMGGTKLVTCPVAGDGADCAERFLFEFGYITFPLMSFSLFVFFIVVLMIHRRMWRKNTDV